MVVEASLELIHRAVPSCFQPGIRKGLRLLSLLLHGWAPGRRTVGGMTWQAYLKGDAFDLETLTVLFPTGDLQVQKDDGGVYVTGILLNATGSAEHALRVAKEWLPMLNSAARVLEASFRPVEVSGSIADGHGNRHVFAEANLSVRSRMTASGAVDMPNVPLPRGTELMRRAASDQNLAEAMVHISGLRVDWVELYKAFEVLKDAAGGLNELSRRASVSKGRLKAFTASANHPAVSGTDGRHARPSGPPPKDTMTIEEARALINLLISSW